MKWGDYIKRTALRRVVWIIVGLAVYAALSALGVARAQTKECYLQGANCTIQEAYAYAAAGVAIATNFCLETPATRPRVVTPYHVVHDPQNTRFRVEGACEHDPWPHNGNWVPKEVPIRTGIYSAGCVDGQWNHNLGRCFDPAECLARNQQEGYGVPTTRAWQSKCVAGCMLAFDSSQGRVCATVAGKLTCSGSLQWTGDQCDLPPGQPPEDDTPPDRPDKATCEQAGDGQSFCIKPNGDHCYTASTGRQICWQPDETGAKSDRDVMQGRNAGPTEIPPANPNLPNGDTLEKKGQSVTTETAVTQGNQTTTITTTTTNYSTQFGTNPGAGNQGEADDGTGGEKDGKGDDEQGSVEGGGDCESPPIARGGDPVVVAIVDQAWATRCAVEAGNAAKVTGDVGDCTQPFTVEGDNANAVKLRAMREQICGEYARGEREGISGGLDAEITSMESEHDSIFGEGSDPGAISSTRYGGGGSCPVIEVTIPGIGTSWTPPPVFCSIIAALRLLFIAVATVWAVRIVGS